MHKLYYESEAEELQEELWEDKRSRETAKERKGERRKHWRVKLRDDWSDLCMYVYAAFRAVSTLTSAGAERRGGGVDGLCWCKAWPGVLLQRLATSSRAW